MYWVLSLARLLLAAFFLMAAAEKLVGGFGTFRRALRDFGVPSALLVLLSIVVPATELWIAGLLLGTSSAVGAISAVALLLIFNAAIAANLWLGRITKSGFGQLHTQAIGWIMFARNSALAVLAGLVGWQGRLYPAGSLLEAVQGVNPNELAAVIRGRRRGYKSGHTGMPGGSVAGADAAFAGD